MVTMSKVAKRILAVICASAFIAGTIPSAAMDVHAAEPDTGISVEAAQDEMTAADADDAVSAEEADTSLQKAAPEEVKEEAVADAESEEETVPVEKTATPVVGVFHKEDSTWVKKEDYPSLQELFDHLETNGGSIYQGNSSYYQIRLLSDITIEENETVEMDYIYGSNQIQLNLNGHSLTIKGTMDVGDTGGDVPCVIRIVTETNDEELTDTINISGGTLKGGLTVDAPITLNVDGGEITGDLYIYVGTAVLNDLVLRGWLGTLGEEVDVTIKGETTVYRDPINPSNIYEPGLNERNHYSVKGPLKLEGGYYSAEPGRYLIAEHAYINKHADPENLPDSYEYLTWTKNSEDKWEITTVAKNDITQSMLQDDNRRVFVKCMSFVELNTACIEIYNGQDDWAYDSNIFMYRINPKLAKETASVTTAPESLDGVTYDGTEKALIDEGLATGGTIYYQLGDDGAYTEEVPKAVEAGTYKINYYVKASDGYRDSEVASMEASIDKRRVTVTAADQTVKSADEVAATVDYAILKDAVNGHVLGSVKYSVDSEAGTITPKDAVIMSGDKNVTDNYAITYVAGKIVEPEPEQENPKPSKSWLAPDADGVWSLFKDGEIDSTYNGLFEDEELGWWLVLDGRVAFDYCDIYKDETYGIWLVQYGKVAFDYNELFGSDKFGWWKIKDGAIDFDYNDLYFSPTYGWWLITNGAVNFGYSDLFGSPTCGWWKINDGTVDFDYSGTFESPLYGTWVIAGGAVDFAASENTNTNGQGDEVKDDFTGLKADSNNEWHLYYNGKVAKDYNDLYGDETYGWWKIKDGAVDFGYTGLYYSENYGWWLILSGQVAFDYSDLWNDEVLGWWKISGGAVDFSFNDLYGSDTYGWWKIADGAVDFGYTGLYYSDTYGWWLIGEGSVASGYNDFWNDPTLGWWKIAGGAVDFNYTGLYYSDTYGWWLIQGGRVAFDYTDLWNDPTLGWWKINGGAVDFNYSDLYNSPTYGWWLITGGMVNFNYNGVFDSPQYGPWTVTGGAVITQ